MVSLLIERAMQRDDIALLIQLAEFHILHTQRLALIVLHHIIGQQAAAETVQYPGNCLSDAPRADDADCTRMQFKTQ